MSARTRGHLHRVAMEHGWREVYSDRQIAEYGRGTGADTCLVRVRYSNTGAIVFAGRRRPGGPTEAPEKGKQTAVRQWLTEPAPPVVQLAHGNERARPQGPR